MKNLLHYLLNFKYIGKNIAGLAILVSAISFTISAQTPAFPGAEGGGMYTSGGRGGQVYFVTNLDDVNRGDSETREGSLRWCINRPGAKTIVFKVAGIIELNSRLDVRDNTTIAGQTAPGDGICLKNYSMYVGGSNIIIRYIRSRMGDEAEYEGDAMWGRNESDVIIDHCSLSWSTDETGSFYDNTNFTLQWSILSESLRESVHGKGSHGYGGIWGGKTASFHHNLLAHHDSRNPRMNGSRYSGEPELELVDFRNNVIYNWGGNSGYAGEGGSYNFVNNYYKAGDASSNRDRIFQPYEGDGGVWGTFYVDGNIVTASSTVTNNNWLGIDPGDPFPGGSYESIKADTEFSVPHVTTHSAEEAFELVLDYAGASLNRDETDARVTNEVENGLAPDRASNGTNKPGLIDTQSDVGGWDTYTYNESEVPVDTDRDGMPDDWEDANGLNKNDPADRNDTNSEGYTNLELYINSLVEHLVVTNTNESEILVNGTNVFPNPLNGLSQIRYELKENSAVNIAMFDLTGREVKNIVNEKRNAGSHRESIEISDLNNGIYLIRIKAGKSSNAIKVIVNN